MDQTAVVIAQSRQSFVTYGIDGLFRFWRYLKCLVGGDDDPGAAIFGMRLSAKPATLLHSVQEARDADGFHPQQGR